MSKKMIKVQMRKERVRKAMKKRSNNVGRLELVSDPRHTPDMDYMEDYDSKDWDEELWDMEGDA